MWGCPALWKMAQDTVSNIVVLSSQLSEFDS